MRLRGYSTADVSPLVFVGVDGLLVGGIKGDPGPQGPAGPTGSASAATTIELGHASDTTLSRVSPGVMAVEGVTVVTVSGVQTLTGKTLTSPVVNTPTGITKSDVGLSNVDNTSDLNKPVSTATSTALAGREPAITAGTAAQYYRGDKSFQALNADAVADGVTNRVFTAAEKTKLSGVATAATANSADATLLSRANHTGTQLASTISDFSTAAATVADGRVVAGITGKENTSNKGIANGYASLDSGGKVPVAQLPNSIMEYQGTWNASTNTPTLANGTGNPGDVYRATVAGTQMSMTFVVGDYIIYNGSTWERSGSTDVVASVAGRTGNITLTKTDVGLANVDNTSDLAKPVSTAVTTALSGREPTLTAGTATQYYRGDKTWQALNADAVADGVTNRLFTAAEKTKLSGVATAATANAADAVLLARANHTGTQLASTVSDFASAADARVAAATSAVQTLSNKTVTNPTINGYTEGLVAVGVVPASATLDISAGTVLTATLTASTVCVFAMPAVGAGKSFTLMLRQPAVTGLGNATFTGVRWANPGAPTITPGAGRMDILSFFSDGVSWFGNYSQGYTP